MKRIWVGFLVVSSPQRRRQRRPHGALKVVMQKDLNRDRVGVPWLSQVARGVYVDRVALPILLKWALGNWLFPFIVIYRPSRASNKGGWVTRAWLSLQPRATWLNPPDWGASRARTMSRRSGVCACVHNNESNLRNSVG